MTMNLGVALALACAVLTQLGFLCKHRGANAVPQVRFTAPVAAARSLFGSRWFALGMVVAVAGWVLHVGALAMAPLSVVQAVLSTGVVMLAVLGAALFGCRVTPRQWTGAAMTAGGLVLLVVTLPGAGGAHGQYAWPTLIAFEAGMLALGALLLAAPGLGAPAPHHGAVVGAAAGILFGVSDVALKALTDAAAGGGAPAVLTSPWLLTAIGASVLAFLASARGFQQGDAVSVIACTSTGANVTAIVAGLTVFGDSLSSGALVVVQIAAFALVAAAALLTPHGHGHVPEPQRA